MSMDRNPRARPLLPIALAVGALVIGVGLLLGAGRLASFVSPPSFHGTTWEPAEPAADFRLVDHTGREVGMEDFRGRAVLLFFGYTHCPDVCPLTLNRLHEVLPLVGEDAGEVEVLLVTVDPGRDTPEVLANYVTRFGPGFTGLTGDEGALEQVRRDYFVYAEPAPPAPSYAAAMDHSGHGAHEGTPGPLNHTPQVFGIDREGQIRVLLPMDRSPAEIAADIRTLLR